MSASVQSLPTPAADVLIVDDNFSVAKALVSVIDKAGFAAIPCHSGADALAYAASCPPRAIVLDIHLPDISGLVVAHKLREQLGADTPIIIVSGDTSMETISALSRVGATYFFPKPVSANALVKQLRELLRG